MDYGENPPAACLRELKEECCVDGVEPELICVAGEPDRDPRKHVISIVYSVMVDPAAQVAAGDDAATATWYDLSTVCIIEGDFINNSQSTPTSWRRSCTRPTRP